ncbi:MAG: ferrous iron transport protein B [Clostridiales bacterium]|nr:ferrous iron transport protein B [Clostridiales bacterium]
MTMQYEPKAMIALAGNPNVGKSTIFNALTGLSQHTGNWPGKTVSTARGFFKLGSSCYELVDVPGEYSLSARSAEEEVARDFICFGGAGAVIIVLDATCLERGLILALQILEAESRAVICVNLMDEARKKGIEIDLKKLEKLLGAKVAGCSASTGEGLEDLKAAAVAAASMPKGALEIEYPKPVLDAISKAKVAVPEGESHRASWFALRLTLGDIPLASGAYASFKKDELEDVAATTLVKMAERIGRQCVKYPKADAFSKDRKIDRIITSRRWGIPIMLFLLALVFWITIVGANYPSQWLSILLFGIEPFLARLFDLANAPPWLSGAVVSGGYKVLAWVVSVMLPPMAVFFPLFTFLEDFGYLPRIAFNLDHAFKKCSACGKQALTMCMGFGCNAAGVIGCRIINSPRERLIAIITNNFAPCNGRFPMILAIIAMFFSSSEAVSALILSVAILAGIGLTFASSKFLSKTLIKGLPSSFILELPPFRKPAIKQILVRSLLDRTLFVLKRAVICAIPAGIFIWVMANISVGGSTLLQLFTSFLDPIAGVAGMDGVILMAFILGSPANEIVLPIMIMAYLQQPTLTDYSSLSQLKDLLTNNGWTWVTAVCAIFFSLSHWPCATTIITIFKETKSFKWTAASVAIPAVTGFAVCAFISFAARLLRLA